MVRPLTSPLRRVFFTVNNLAQGAGKRLPLLLGQASCAKSFQQDFGVKKMKELLFFQKSGTLLPIFLLAFLDFSGIHQCSFRNAKKFVASSLRVVVLSVTMLSSEGRRRCVLFPVLRSSFTILLPETDLHRKRKYAKRIVKHK
jgi:hypothetical protein